MSVNAAQCSPETTPSAAHSLNGMGNRLLASMDPDTLTGVRPKLSRVSLGLQEVIYREDQPIEFVYFVETGLLAMVNSLVNGMQAEVGLIGRDGMAGASLIAGVSTSFVETMVLIPGIAWRMNRKDFQLEVHENSAFRTLLLRYGEALQAQIMQSAACNGRHELEQRLARWLLMVHDYAEGDQLPLTQELISRMLGVHRPSITVAAGSLQRASLIRYNSGRITIVDQAGLEAVACECYDKVRRRFDAVLGASVAKRPLIRVATALAAECATAHSIAASHTAKPSTFAAGTHPSGSTFHSPLR